VRSACSTIELPWQRPRSRAYITFAQESQLLEEQCITDISDPRFDPRVYTEYDITLVKNRMYYLRALDAGLSVRLFVIINHMHEL
jgi:hypothetical protein